MNRRVKWIGICCGAALAAACAWLMAGASTAQGDSGATATTAPATQPADADQDNAVATVQTATARTGDIAQNLTLYGTVTYEPGAAQIQSVPVDVRVVGLHVVSGQPIQKAAPLIDVEASPDAQLQLLDARNGLAAAKKDLQDTQQRFNLKLATTAELQQAQQAEQTAQVKLDNLERRGVGQGVTKLRAEFDALVAKIDVQTGQLVPAGNALVELLPADAIAARLGVEPGIAGQLQVGQAVQISSVGGGPHPTTGHIRSVGQRLNLDTRLVDVYVSLEAADHPVLDSYIRGDLTINDQKALLVPRDAVLPADEGFTLFTVKQGHAVKHTVSVAMQNDQDAAIVAADVHAGDVVVTQGNLELDDGTAVTTGSVDAGDTK